ncbi:MAG: TrbG/VirB9 family P-type conjugative transfer protein [Alphaproteobacteria bacterium]|nr:TrbG/VirB9 family P-type conjugative transfer protein [Alphaproteobacteria bacterium]
MKKILYITAVLGFMSGAALAQSSGSIDPTTMDKIDSMIEQSSGSYPPLDVNFMTSRGMLQKAWSEPMKNMGEGQTSPGYSRYSWAPEKVLPVRLRESMATLINFPAWEVIDSIWIGDTSSFVGEFPSPNSLLLFTQPGMIGVDSNLIVFGRSGNRYAFYLRSEGYNTDRITNAVVDVIVPNAPSGSGVTGGVSSNTPGWVSGMRGSGMNPAIPGNSLNPSAALNVASNAPKNWLEGIPTNPEKFRFDIEVYLPNPNDIDIAPERVWHDEIFTYIDFGPKALAMLERPIVNLIVQDSEVPVGFRTRGPNGRLIIVEAVGDMVLRNGQKIVCLKLRKDPAFGLDYIDYSTYNEKHWDVQAPIGPNATKMPGSQNAAAKQAAGQAMPEDMVIEESFSAWLGNNGKSGSVNSVPAGMRPLPTGVADSRAKADIRSTLSSMAKDGQRLGYFAAAPAGQEKIAIELGSDKEISKLEDSWNTISRRNRDLIGSYQPYFSVDTSAESGEQDLFRLRVGPISDIKVGDKICGQLSRRGLNCIVVRTQ